VWFLFCVDFSTYFPVLYAKVPENLIWSFGGDVNNEDVTIQPRQTRVVSLTAQRQESGRGQSPMRARITAKATFGTVQVTDQVIIKQIKGKPAFKVIRQEYEDVESDGEDAPSIPSPRGNFTITPDATGNPTLPSSNPRNPSQGNIGFCNFPDVPGVDVPLSGPRESFEDKRKCCKQPGPKCVKGGS
jgi:hypothetical protein